MPLYVILMSSHFTSRHSVRLPIPMVLYSSVLLSYAFLYCYYELPSPIPSYTIPLHPVLIYPNLPLSLSLPLSFSPSTDPSSHVHFAPLVSQSSSPSPSPSPSAWGSTGKQLVRLPPVLWAPVSSRHKQFPAQFRDAVHVLLLASRHCSSSSSNSSSGSSSSSSSAVKHVYRSFPVHIWTFILSFASR
jgi:hypothetical protein